MKIEALIAAGWNLVFAGGVLLVAFGVWCAWKPAGFMFAGLVLAVIGWGGGLEQVRKGGLRR